jgi:hypothetical protein
VDDVDKIDSFNSKLRRIERGRHRLSAETEEMSLLFNIQFLFSAEVP